LACTPLICADHCIGAEGGERIAIPEPSIVRHNRLAEKRIYRDCRIGEFVGSDDMTLSSRPIASISASLHSYQSRSKSAAWFHGTWHRNKIRQRSYFEVAAHTWCRSRALSPLDHSALKRLIQLNSQVLHCQLCSTTHPGRCLDTNDLSAGRQQFGQHSLGCRPPTIPTSLRAVG
jgi:hypothetical protein